MKKILDSAEYKKLLADKTSGSTDLLFALNSLLRKNYSRETEKRRLISDLKKNFSSFEAIRNYLDSLSRLQNADKKSLEAFFETHSGNKQSVFENIFNSAVPCLKNKSVIATLSNSRTVAEILIRLGRKRINLKVLICESRPKKEGRLMAERLAAAGIAVKFFTDAAMAGMILNCDAAICGADMILSGGNIINKTGSRTMAVLCSYYKKPFYIVADKTKFSSKKTFTETDKPAGEIYQPKNRRIIVRNKYFECVDKKLITRIFTD